MKGELVPADPGARLPVRSGVLLAIGSHPVRAALPCVAVLFSVFENIFRKRDDVDHLFFGNAESHLFVIRSGNVFWTQRAGSVYQRGNFAIGWKLQQFVPLNTHDIQYGRIALIARQLMFGFFETARSFHQTVCQQVLQSVKHIRPVVDDQNLYPPQRNNVCHRRH